MIRCYAYTRVSTVKQGEHGVSLQEQRAAIERYSARLGIEIVTLFEERVTAAKRGRPLFTRMLKKLRAGEAQGVVIHKIDRSARNLRDWAELGELIDAGVRVYFANESVDLQSRGGRLSADIQAVVAADYIRNLREETLKGIYGRLKQGLLPFRAPLGYLDTGGGKCKEPDPVRAPFIRDAFTLYARGSYSLDSLVEELYRRGLRNQRGHKVTRNGLSTVLNSLFYTGIIRLERTGETFQGRHEPLISMSLFKQVQDRLRGHYHTDRWKHEFLLRGLFRCSLCGRQLIGERQKGNVYYRCHTKGCPTKGFREEALEEAMLSSWAPIALYASEKDRLREQLLSLTDADRQAAVERRNGLQAQLSSIRGRRERLVDALVDGLLDKTRFDERSQTLSEEEQQVREQLAVCEEEGVRRTQETEEVLELASVAQQGYRLATPEEKREMATLLCSNRQVAGKELLVEPHSALRRLAEGRLVQ